MRHKTNILAGTARAVSLAWLLCAAAGMQAGQDGRLLLNEVCVANVDRHVDPSYNYGGWVELYNPAQAAVALSGFRLRHTDAEGKVRLYRLTDAHGSVPPRGHAVLWFDHNSADGYYGPDAGTQVPFRLDADGGLVELLDAGGALLDAVEYPPSIARCSWMRETDGADRFGWTSLPTPKAANDGSPIAEWRLPAPLVSTSGGLFNEDYSFTVAVPAHATLYYTTDGSAPRPGLSPASADGKFSGTENAVYRFMLAADGSLDSPVVTRTFIKSEGQFTLPLLCVSTAPANLFDNTIGVYVTGTNGRIANNSKVKANQNMDWERPVNVEYYLPDTHREGRYAEVLNQESALSIFGGWTRFNPGNDHFQYRSSFKLKSDKVFEGASSFPFPIFSSKPYVKIKNFLVRNGGQDSNARIWDAAIQELLRTSGIYLDCQAWQPAHVWLDGSYLGMMNLREESNKQFAFSNYGISKDEIDQWEGDIIIKEGDRKKLDEWYDLSKKLAANPADTAVWNAICQIVDIDEYCNYMAAETYMGNLDWLRGGFKNIKGFRAKDDGKFHIVLHDVDGGFGDTDMILQVLNKGNGSLPVRFKNMLKYEPFRKQFIDAYCIMDGSVFDPERCEPIITAMKNTVTPALRLEGLSADEKADLLIERLSDNTVRRPALKQSLKTAFSLTDEYTVTLKSSIPEAKTLLNGQEIPTGRFNGYLFPPVTLTASAPGGTAFKGWNVNGKTVSADSILHLSKDYPPGTFEIEAVYERTAAGMPPVLINEVSAGNDIYINEYGKKADWIELYNCTDTDIDLAGAWLSDDPGNACKSRLTPSAGTSTIIPAHGYKIIWCDGKESRTQLHASFKLKNSDDAYVSITDAESTWTDTLHYKKQPRWKTYGRFPDGSHTLAMFERPTIGNSNRLSTNTVLETPDGMDNHVTENTTHHVVAVRYYNLSGQQIINIEAERIVIQQIIYSDGSTQSRKIVNPR